MKRPKICIISFSNLKIDPRVRRQIKFLKDKYAVTTFGLEKSGVEGIEEFIIPQKRNFYDRFRSRLKFLFARLFKELYNNYIGLKYPVNDILKLKFKNTYDIIIANGLDALIIAERLSRKNYSKILFDAHEYEPKRIEDQWFHRIFINPYKDFLCRKYLPEISAFTTVSSGIKDEYNKNYGFKPKVIMNAPEYTMVNPHKVRENSIKLIHHGIAHPSRKLEDMIYLTSALNKKFNLTLMLIPKNIKYYNYLKKLGKRICPGRVTFKNPVPFNKIISTISKFDIGLVIFRPTSIKLKYMLPNKFFESIMAGLALVIGPSPEMKKILEKYNCGYMSNSFDIKDIASLINELSIEEIEKKKRASLEAAKTLNAESEMDKFLKIIEDILSDKI